MNLTAQQWLFLLAFTVMLIGLVGTLAPVIPGIALIWVTGLVYAIVERFGAFDPISFIVFTLLGALGVSSEFLLTQAGAKVTGASRRAMIGGVVGAGAGFAIGLFVGGIGSVPGALIGALAGVTLIEYQQHRDLKKAGLVAGGWLAGCLASKVVAFLIALSMVAIFVWQAGIRP
jgi:uncharacterized protein YqgC (DUF456 family)